MQASTLVVTITGYVWHNMCASRSVSHTLPGIMFGHWVNWVNQSWIVMFEPVKNFAAHFLIIWQITLYLTLWVSLISDIFEKIIALRVTKTSKEYILSKYVKEHIPLAYVLTRVAKFATSTRGEKSVRSGSSRVHISDRNRSEQNLHNNRFYTNSPTSLLFEIYCTIRESMQLNIHPV